MTSYVDYLRGLVPPWMLTPQGRRWLNVFGRFKDAEQDRLRQALKARFVGECPEDALMRHGRDRQILRVPGESAEAYRARLLGAWDAWERAGTPTGIVDQVKTLGYSNVELFENSTPAGGNWAGPPDGDTVSWWRFWVRIGIPNPWSDWTWGDGGLWGDDRTWGSTAMSWEVDTIRAIIRKWRPAHAQCAGILVELGHNLVPYANDVTASGWTAVGLSTVNRDRIIDSIQSSIHGVWRTLSEAPDGPVIASVEARAGARSQVCLADSSTCANRAIVDLLSGTVVSSNIGAVTVQELTGGWRRVLVTAPSWTTSTIAVAIAKDGAVTYAGDGNAIFVRSVRIWNTSRHPTQTITWPLDIKPAPGS